MSGLFTKLQQLTSLSFTDSALIMGLKEKREEWQPAKDQYQRTVLHLAALNGNTKLVRCLVLSGAHVNAKDGIHQTPLTLSLHKNHINTAKFLLEIGANVSEIFFKETASPLEIAKVKNMDILVAMIENRQQYERDVTNFLASEFQRIFENSHCHSQAEACDDMDVTNQSSSTETTNYARILNINVGDQKNTVTIQGCANRCPDQYGCHTPGAGDFHNRGYVNECLARFAGQGGFWHVVEKVLRRPTVNPQSFKKKFKDNNYNNNEEALADYEDGISIAMLKAFHASSYFPTQAELDECHRVNKSHNSILLQKFYEWSKTIQTDKMADYHMKLANQILPYSQMVQRVD